MASIERHSGRTPGFGPFLTKDMTLTFNLAISVAAAALTTTSASYAADRELARNKVEMMCANCHGVDGIATLPGAANLAGQQDEYLRGQLKAYRSGARKDPVMGVVAKTLSDEDIVNLAAWYSGLKVTVEMPSQ